MASAYDICVSMSAALSSQHFRLPQKPSRLPLPAPAVTFFTQQFALVRGMIREHAHLLRSLDARNPEPLYATCEMHNSGS